MSDQTVTLESAIALVKYATLQPLAGTTNLLRLVNNPEVWLAKIWPRAPTGFLKLSLSLLLCAGVLRSANNLLSWAVLNNFRRDRYNWRRELVVVTGGSGGLGDLLVRKLAKHSIKVISLDITPPKIPLPSNAFFYRVDITSSASIVQVAQQIRYDHGDPTILVNNAGLMNISTMLDESEDQIRRVFDVNIIAHFLLVKEFLPAMIKQNHGHVVTVASVASFVTGVRNVDYACTKVSVLAFHEGLAQELKHTYKARNVRTSIIHPTYVRTPLIDAVHKGSRAKFKSYLLEPETVVDAIFGQILSGNSSQVIIPGRYTSAAGLRGWPSWLQEIIRSAQQDVLAH